MARSPSPAARPRSAGERTSRTRRRGPSEPERPRLAKVPSGIAGLDAVTGGGLPKGRPTLVAGGAGCGKTLFAMEFLVRGATLYGEPGVFMAFEETAHDLAENVKSLGFDLPALERAKKIVIDYVRVERSEIEETGEYDLEGLFIRLNHAIEAVGAKRVVLDTIESLFSGLPNALILRAELRRLFRWLKDRGMTTVITGERGEGTLTRHGLEEYVSDCVLYLDHRVHDQTSTRRLRVVKYRGSDHGTNEYPFLIGEDGISVMPLSAAGLAHPVTTQRISTGIPRLDEMLGGRGYYRGSSVLISGTAGTGKTTLLSEFAHACAARGEKCLFFSFEESPDQIVRNMRSVGIDLARDIGTGLLRIHSSRPSAFGLEMHLATLHKQIVDFRPRSVVVDPISNLTTAGTRFETLGMFVRLIDYLKERGITSVFTTLTGGGEDIEQSEVGVSSIIDTWLLLQTVRVGGERNRTLSIIKSRGMAHSNQACEYTLDAKGIQFADAYLGAEGGLTGSLRVAQEERDREVAQAERQGADLARRRAERRRRTLERRIEALKERIEEEGREAREVLREGQDRRDRATAGRGAMAESRGAFGESGNGPGNGRPARRRRRA